MNTTNCFTRWSYGALISTLTVFLLTGCQSSKEENNAMTPAASAPAAAAAPVATATPPAATAPTATSTPVAMTTIRIDAGATNSYTDSSGNVWLADQGFADGDTAYRADDLKIANTADPAIYRTEHYGMTLFSYPVPNGKYVVKLHFAETYDGNTGPGDRVFSFKIGDQEFKSFDVWARAGGPNRAYVLTVNVEVTNGKLDISFIPNVGDPEINGIEIIPAT